MNTPNLATIRAAAERIAPHAHRTPVLSSRYFDARLAARVVFKCENFQKVGAFKFRGALNAVLSLSDEEASRGVVTHSSGNHAQALALAATIRGISATIVMPENAPQVKRAAVADYGATIVLCQPTLAARERATEEVIRGSGATLIHPYNDARIIAGQGTAALELLEDLPGLDLVVAPVGGGGLLSGTAIAVRGVSSHARVLGAEPAGADDACRSLSAGHIIPVATPDTIADGLRTSLGDITFPILRELVDGILLVDDASIARAMKLVWERMKIVIEPSAAVPVAAILEHADRVAGKRVGVILSGGNVDLDRLPWMEKVP
jgi:threonine dehydratase